MYSTQIQSVPVPITLLVSSCVRVVGTVASNTRNKVGGQYPLKAIGEHNRNLLSDTVAQLNATVMRPDIAGSFRTPPPNNVLNIAVHGLYNPPPSDGHLRHHHHAATTCSAMFHVPGAIDLRVIIIIMIYFGARDRRICNNNKQVFFLFWFYFPFSFFTTRRRGPALFSRAHNIST